MELAVYRYTSKIDALQWPDFCYFFCIFFAYLSSYHEKVINVLYELA